MTTQQKTRISIFVVVWLLVFGYESLRRNYLSPLFGAELPKVMFLFPPAGWIMFYRVDDSAGWVEVWGRAGERRELIDPHRILTPRWVGYDNIRRNVLIAVLDRACAPSFCRYLRRKFPHYDEFEVVQVWMPSVTREPERRIRQAAYRCR